MLRPPLDAEVCGRQLFVTSNASNAQMRLAPKAKVAIFLDAPLRIRNKYRSRHLQLPTVESFLVAKVRRIYNTDWAFQEAYPIAECGFRIADLENQKAEGSRQPKQKPFVLTAYCFL